MGRGSSRCWTAEAVDMASVPRAAAATSSRDVHFFHTANLPPTPRVFVCSVHAQTSPAVPALIWGGGGRWSLRPPSASRGNKKGSPASPSSPASCCDARSRGGPEGPIFAARGTHLGDKGASVIFLKSHPPKCTPTPSLLCQWLKQKKKKKLKK